MGECIEIKLIEDYKSAEEVIVNEKVKYVFIDSLSETIDESEIIKRGENVGFNVYFTMITYECFWGFTIYANYKIMNHGRTNQTSKTR